MAGRYNWQTQMSLPTSKPRVSTVWISAVGAFAAAFLALVSTLPTYFSMLTHGHSFARMLAWQLSCWGIWAIVGPWIVRIQSRYGALRLIALGVALTLAQAVISAQMTVWLHPFTPIATYDFRHAWNMNWRLSIAIDPLVYGLLLVAGSFLASYDRARRLELRESHLESELTRAQLDALRLEIQPHFLFNTLNSIAALIRMKDNQGALSMLVGLSEMMRVTLDRSARSTDAARSRSSALVKRYVDLQRVRFGDRLDVAYLVTPIVPATRRAVVPASADRGERVAARPGAKQPCRPSRIGARLWTASTRCASGCATTAWGCRRVSISRVMPGPGCETSPRASSGSTGVTRRSRSGRTTAPAPSWS